MECKTCPYFLFNSCEYLFFNELTDIQQARMIEFGCPLTACYEVNPTYIAKIKQIEKEKSYILRDLDSLFRR